MKLQQSYIFLIGLFVIAIVGQVNCLELPPIQESDSVSYFTSLFINTRPLTCDVISSQPDDPPTRSYPVVTWQASIISSGTTISSSMP